MSEAKKAPRVVHLVDGTYELFRHFYSPRPTPGKYGAVGGVLGTVLSMIKDGATHIGVATDHVVESFRNDLWDGYKTGEGMDPKLWAQFHPLEDALEAMGVAVWRMKELEADDGLASAAAIAAKDKRVEKICIWTPDKDLAQCVVGDRIVQMDRRNKVMRDAGGVKQKFGVEPKLIPDYLALVGDSADGFPGVPRIGAKTAARLLNEYGPIEKIPDSVLGEHRDNAMLFKKLATLVTDAPLFDDVAALRWAGPKPGFGKVAEGIDPRLAQRAAGLVP